MKISLRRRREKKNGQRREETEEDVENILEWTGVKLAQLLEKTSSRLDAQLLTSFLPSASEHWNKNSTS